METTILHDHKNPFLGRRELILEITSASAPSFESVHESLKGQQGEIVIKKVSSNFGKKKFLAEVYVYHSLEDKKKSERPNKKTRLKMKEEAKVAAEEAKKAKAEAKKASGTN